MNSLGIGLKDLGIIGAVVPNITPKVTKICREYNITTVQVPLHITEPEPEHVQEMVDAGVVPCLKWVPPRDAHKDVGRWRNWFEKMLDQYHMVKFWDIGGEPETDVSQPGCRWDGDYSSFACFIIDMMKETINRPLYWLGAGFLSATFNGLHGNEDRSKFVYELFKYTEYRNLIDALSVNQYVYGYGGDENILAGYLKMHMLTGYSSMVISEIGVPCCGDERYLHIIQSKDQQAVSFVKCITTSVIAGYNTIYWFRLFAGPWGVFEIDWQPRPAARAMKFLGSLLTHKHLGRYYQMRALPCDVRDMSDQIVWYRFEIKGVCWMHVIWSKIGTLHRETKKAKAIYTVTGEKISEKEFIISRDPVIILTESEDDLKRLEY